MGSINNTWEQMYVRFNRSELTSSQLVLWAKGTRCTTNNTLIAWLNVTEFVYPQLTAAVMYCPMPFQTSDYNTCCSTVAGDLRCCLRSNSSTFGPVTSPNVTSSQYREVSKWSLAVGIALPLVVILALIAVCFNRFTGIIYRSSQNTTDSARPKIAVNRKRYIVKPVDKRILLRTGDYTVEQSWEQITVRFFNREYFDKFKDALICRYPVLVVWRDPRRKPEAQVLNASGQQVRLALARDTRAIFVTDVGAPSWVMSDFQTICKNIHVTTFICETTSATPPPRQLSPRHPTIGEQSFDGGDFKVKVCQSEIEIKFVREDIFESFKRTLLFRYPTLEWNKFLQRDCARILLESGKTVTIHMWEGLRSVWLSGDGKRDWYMKEFYELQADAAVGRIPSDTFTTKMLEGGGCEVEFPSSEYTKKIGEQLTARYPSAKWREVNYRQEVTLSVPLTTLTSGGTAAKDGFDAMGGGAASAAGVKLVKSKSRLLRRACCQIVVQLGNATSDDRKLWVSAAESSGFVGSWIDAELSPIYEAVRDAIAVGARSVAAGALNEGRVAKKGMAGLGT